MTKSETIIIRKANGTYASIIMGIWLLPWAGITGTMVYGILFDNNGRTEDYLTILTPLAIVGLLVIRQFLWNLRGRDEITFTETSIILSRKGSFFHRPVTELPYKDFYGFAPGNFNNAPRWVLFWGLGGNRIVANCGTYSRFIAQGITKPEAALMVDELNSRWKSAKNDH